LNILFSRLPSLLYKKGEEKEEKSSIKSEKLIFPSIFKSPTTRPLVDSNLGPSKKLLLNIFLGFYSFPLMGKVRETFNQPSGLF